MRVMIDALQPTVTAPPAEPKLEIVFGHNFDRVLIAKCARIVDGDTIEVYDGVNQSVYLSQMAWPGTQ